MGLEEIRARRIELGIIHEDMGLGNEDLELVEEESELNL